MTSDLPRVIADHSPRIPGHCASPPQPPGPTIPSQSPLSLSLKGTILPLNTKFYHKNTLTLTRRGVAVSCISNQSWDQVIYVCCSSGICYLWLHCQLNWGSWDRCNTSHPNHQCNPIFLWYQQTGAAPPPAPVNPVMSGCQDGMKQWSSKNAESRAWQCLGNFLLWPGTASSVI